VVEQAVRPRNEVGTGRVETSAAKAPRLRAFAAGSRQARPAVVGWVVGATTYARPMSLTADEITAAGLRLDVDDPHGTVATVTLSRADKRNAQTPAMWHALAAIGEQLPETVRVVVVRGAGHSFSALLYGRGSESAQARVGTCLLRCGLRERGGRLL